MENDPKWAQRLGLGFDVHVMLRPMTWLGGNSCLQGIPYVCGEGLWVGIGVGIAFTVKVLESRMSSAVSICVYIHA